MAQPNSSFDEILSTTIKRYGPQFYDAVTNNVTFYRYLRDRGQIQKEDGGYSLLEHVAFDDNDSFQWYSGYETLALNRNDQLTTAEFNWRQAAVAVQASGREMRQNMGETRKFNRVKELVKNAERTFMNQLGAAVYNDGTDTKQIDGLRLYVESTTPASQTSTVGGISRQTYAFWRNQATVSGTTATAANIQGRMNSSWLACKRGSDVPQLILAGNNYFSLYWAALQDYQRITAPTKGSSGYKSLSFYGPGGEAMVEYDDQCNTDTMYFLNLDFLKLCVHSDADIRVLEDRNPIDQDAFVRWLIFMGQMTVSNCARQGVLTET